MMMTLGVFYIILTSFGGPWGAAWLPSGRHEGGATPQREGATPRSHHPPPKRQHPPTSREQYPKEPHPAWTSAPSLGALLGAFSNHN